MVRISTIWLLALLLAPSANAGWFSGGQFRTQRYPGEARPAEQISRLQLMGRIGPVIIRTYRAGEDRLYDDGHSWWGATYADFLPGTYTLKFRSSHIVVNRKGEARSETPLLTGVTIEAVLKAGHTYRIRPAPGIDGFDALKATSAYIVEDLGKVIPQNCFQIINLLTDVDPETGFAKTCPPQ